MRDDIEFNINFCKLVEKYPELYDFNRSDYSNRHVQDKAWSLIARELNESANDCKERWKNIRGRYGKVYKSRRLPSGSAAKKVKEYYLGPHLQFLNNFLKPRRSRAKTVPEEVLNTFDADDNSTFEEASNSEESPFTSNSATNKSKIKSPDTTDSDFCFLKSVLPDMMAMTPQQKRRFKIGVLNLVTQVLEENDTAISCGSSTITETEIWSTKREK